ncbi:hypothetical protein H6F38_23205 [Paenibacillus sp. EKM208P]|nr:hypothetical protein H6F38_23205 [Paenibacillus sp. EKM208P]
MNKLIVTNGEIKIVNDKGVMKSIFGDDGSVTIKGNYVEVNGKECFSQHEKDLILNDHAILKNANEEYKKALEDENEELEEIVDSYDRVLESVFEFIYEKGLHNELLDVLHGKNKENPELLTDRDYEFASEVLHDMYHEDELDYEGLAEAFDSSEKIKQIKKYLKKCESNLDAVDTAINQSKISNLSKKKETIQDLLEFLDKVQLWMKSE